jgi:hypothetical protein
MLRKCKKNQKTRPLFHSKEHSLQRVEEAILVEWIGYLQCWSCGTPGKYHGNQLQWERERWINVW